MTGPRSRAVGPSQCIGKRLADPVRGCEVSRMCDVRLAGMGGDATSRIEKALPPVRRRRAFERGLDARQLRLATVTTLLPVYSHIEMIEFYLKAPARRKTGWERLAGRPMDRL